MKKSGRKLKSRSGVTLIELLLTILILSMIVLLAVSGIKAVKRNLRTMALQYDAGRMKKQILEAVMEELRYAEGEDIEELMKLFTERYPEQCTESYTGLQEEGNGLEEEGSYQTAEFSGLRVCPLDEEFPLLQWEPEISCVRISFGICDEEGHILETVKDLRIRVWNIGGSNKAGDTVLPAASPPTASPPTASPLAASPPTASVFGE